MLLQLLTIVFLVGPQAPGQPAAPAPAAARSAQPARKLFNETADAKAQIATAVAGAADDDIRVLVVWGANEDERSATLPKVQRAQEVAGPRFFSDEYKLVYVDVGKADKNLDVASAYGMKLAADDLPAFTVLDKTGAVMQRATAATFAVGSDAASLDPKKFAAFLAATQAPAPEAEPPLRAALGQAKKDGRYVFLWFSAPW
jgi:hypothetical protein